jgi:hypothetical protein
VDKEEQTRFFRASNPTNALAANPALELRAAEAGETRAYANATA